MEPTKSGLNIELVSLKLVKVTLHSISTDKTTQIGLKICPSLLNLVHVDNKHVTKINFQLTKVQKDNPDLILLDLFVTRT